MNAGKAEAAAEAEANERRAGGSRWRGLAAAGC